MEHIRFNLKLVLRYEFIHYLPYLLSHFLCWKAMFYTLFRKKPKVKLHLLRELFSRVQCIIKTENYKKALYSSYLFCIFANMELYFSGIIIALATFIIIGVFHPIVIKMEYYTGTRYWWILLVTGLISVGCALLVENVMYSSMLGVLGASLLWSIGELFDQKKRVKRGWFPMNPKRKHEYED